MDGRIACSVKDAASTIGVCPNTLYKHMREGRLEYSKLGARRLIKIDSLRQLVDTLSVAA